MGHRGPGPSMSGRCFSGSLKLEALLLLLLLHFPSLNLSPSSCVYAPSARRWSGTGAGKGRNEQGRSVVKKSAHWLRPWLNPSSTFECRTLASLTNGDFDTAESHSLFTPGEADFMAQIRRRQRSRKASSFQDGVQKCVGRCPPFAFRPDFLTKSN